MYIVQIFIKRQNPVGKQYFQNGNRFFETHEYIGCFQYKYLENILADLDDNSLFYEVGLSEELVSNHGRADIRCHGMYDADNKRADMFEINYEDGLSVHIGRPLIWDKKSI